MEINGILLIQTCGACPEQYDAFKNGVQVGYLRLRHGHFRVSYPNSDGEIIYEAEPKGDGIFESEERDFYLNEATKAISKKLNGNILYRNADQIEEDVKMMDRFVEINKNEQVDQYTEAWNRLKKILRITDA